MNVDMFLYLFADVMRAKKMIYINLTRVFYYIHRLCNIVESCDHFYQRCTIFAIKTRIRSKQL